MSVEFVRGFRGNPELRTIEAKRGRRSADSILPESIAMQVELGNSVAAIVSGPDAPSVVANGDGTRSHGVSADHGAVSDFRNGVVSLVDAPDIGSIEAAIHRRRTDRNRADNASTRRVDFHQSSSGTAGCP